MIIGLAAAEGTILCQGAALRSGLQALGHEVVAYDDPGAAFVFVGNPPYEQYLDLCARKPVIFNVLDLAPHCKEHEDIVYRLFTQLPMAARATTISESVQSQLKSLCAVNADVIYYPMKPVTYTRARKYPQFKVAMVGRTSDPNKRCHAAVLSLVRAGFNESEVAIIGPEYPGWGARLGTVSDEVLNDIYNSVDYVMMFSKNEGIGLSAPEGACAGAIPIVLPDLSTYNDFWAASPLHSFYQSFTSIDRVSTFLSLLESRPEDKQQMQSDIRAYADTHLRPKFDPVEVAKRIISVYESIS